MDTANRSRLISDTSASPSVMHDSSIGGCVALLPPMPEHGWLLCTPMMDSCDRIVYTGSLLLKFLMVEYTWLPKSTKSPYCSGQTSAARLKSMP